MARLTTHILDTMHGGPADRVSIRLYRLDGGRELMTSVSTNTDGRTDDALLAETAMQSGTFELEFDVGEYFERRNVPVAEPAFLDTVVIRFAIRADENYHVPLLVSPWSYSTYRGS
ncbi:MAG: hydroxyisourate hydrolase [Gammaproteobacteria bacterium]|nr:hydroxyisourate hydrolase [Gammaproteobacteria bacterium]